MQWCNIVLLDYIVGPKDYTVVRVDTSTCFIMSDYAVEDYNLN